VDRAICIAERCGLPIKIAAKIDAADQDYFDETIRPLLGKPSGDFIGAITDAQKSDFLSGALALLVPIDWPETFGLVTIEAMACGTPVIAFNRGSVPEVIEDGLTGYLIEDETSAISAVCGACHVAESECDSKSDLRLDAWPSSIWEQRRN
jgi:glycosyltransferase involved in cell wall biosynthesis